MTPMIRSHITHLKGHTYETESTLEHENSPSPHANPSLSFPLQRRLQGKDLGEHL